MNPVVYDAGPLIAAERHNRRFWAEHRIRLELGIVPCVPSPVLAQVSRSPTQAQLRRLLRGCEVVPLDEAGAHAAGALLGKSQTTDVSDAVLVSVAMARKADIVTDDRTDIEHLVSAAGSKIRVVAT
jgi:hypothetical protein